MSNEMIHSLKENPLFEPWQDPVSGITSYILKDRAPIQQSFYFTNQSLSADGRYLWFYAAHPPSGSAEIGRTLSVADLQQGTVTLCPETQFRDASPYVDPESGAAYWVWGYSVFRRDPSPDAQAVLVNSVPEEVHKNRYGKRLATHLTRSADGKEFFIDAHWGDEWCVGSLPLDGSDFVPWQRFDRCYNHAQFSPTDPDMALMAQDWWIDIMTGEQILYDNRIWVIRRGQQARPIFESTKGVTHEWWDADGKHIWYIHTTRGTEKISIDDGEPIVVWPNGTCHSHCSKDGTYVAGDINTYEWSNGRGACRVAFYNTWTKREITIASDLPLPKDSIIRYHAHPHPQFCVDDSVIAYTTTVRNRIDVALVNVRELIDATS